MTTVTHTCAPWPEQTTAPWLVEACLRTIPLPERISVLGGIIRHVAEQLPAMGLYYSGTPDAFANRLVNVSSRSGGCTNPAWNAHEWDVES